MFQNIFENLHNTHILHKNDYYIQQDTNYLPLYEIKSNILRKCQQRNTFNLYLF